MEESTKRMIWDSYEVWTVCMHFVYMCVSAVPSSDPFLPRVCELASTSSDRQTKVIKEPVTVTAIECIYMCVHVCVCGVQCSREV